MKKLLLLALLAGCTSAPAEDPTHKAIAALLQKNMNDPASYQPARWSKPEPWTVGDSISADLYILKSRLHQNKELTKTDSIHLASISRLTNDQDLLKPTTARLAEWRRERDSLRQAIHAVPAARDTARLGYYLTHSFRAKNKLGALVLDSVEFYVDKAGRVKMRS